MAEPADLPTGSLLEAPPPAVSPWQRLYSGAHRLRAGWYRTRSRGLPRPVLSIGNLHWGGAGKTPLTAAVARYLNLRGARVCILSRGYGSYRGHGSLAHGVRVVSRGDGPLLSPEAAGDEPVLLAGELAGVAVVVGPDRYRAGLAALELLRPAPDVFLLDDGFSHLALRRDLDLLAFPAADPFGGGRLWPGGRLREPLAAAARADAVVLTGAQLAGTGAEPAHVASAGAEIRGAKATSGTAATSAGLSDGAEAFHTAASGAPHPAVSAAGAALAAALRPYGFAGPGFASSTLAGAALLHAASGGVPLPAGSRVLLVSAIARPEAFAAAARELDFAVMGELRFPDHHPYPPASLERIAAAVAASGAAAALVTSKDRVKLAGRLAAPLAELPVAAVPEPAFWDWLDGAVGRLTAGGSRAPAADPGRLAAES
jgi:tetraacyldisaccharide-1-P 4'-kinase